MINVEGIIQYLSFMSNNLIIMSKARRILKMYTEGVSKQSISVHTGATRNTVKKYIRQFVALGMTLEEINKLSDTQLEALFSLPRQEADISAKGRPDSPLSRCGKKPLNAKVRHGKNNGRNIF